MPNKTQIFVYVDYRSDTNTPFYVGKGTIRRVNDMKRNDLWNKIAAKHGVERKIMFETNDNEFALHKESELIRELKTRNYQGGANFTDGGEGTLGYKMPLGARTKIARAMLGRKFSSETLLKMSRASKGRKYPNRKRRPPISDETRRKLSEKARNRQKRVLTEEHKRKISETLKGRIRPENVRKKISRSHKRRALNKGEA